MSKALPIDVIKSSGNSFHSSVIRKIESLGWNALISPYYLDDLTNKPREIDLIAEKIIPVSSDFRYLGKIAATLKIRLIIECKYISDTTVFWFHKRNEKNASAILDRKMSISSHSVSSKKHHYLMEKNAYVAKMFANASSKKGEIEKDPIFKAFNQVLTAEAYFQSNQIEIASGQNQRDITLTFPVVICNSFDDFYQVFIDNPMSTPSQIENNFILEVDYAKNGFGTMYCLIDIVAFEKIDDYIQTIISDAQSVGDSNPLGFE